MRSWKTPTSSQIDKVVAVASRPGHLRHFFEKLENPLWVEPMAECGFFSEPPVTYIDEASGSTIHPRWPASRYLVRMATLNPEAVLSVFTKIERTKNAEVLVDMVEAALNLPPELAEELVRHIQDWLDIENNYYLPSRLADLTVKFVGAMRLEIAIDLFKSVFAVRPDPRQELKFKKPDEYPFPPQPGTFFEFWEYTEQFRRVAACLREADPRSALETLTELLNDAVFKSRMRRDNLGPEDYSSVWRPAVEEHQSNDSDDLKNLLTEGVRDAAISAVEVGDLSSIVDFLDAQPWRIFHRVALHVMSLYGEQDLKATGQRILKFELYDEPGIRHEASALLAAFFSRLNADDRTAYLGWVDSGPDVDKYRESSKSWSGRDVTDADIEQYILSWKVERLWPIGDHLPHSWKERFEEMRSRAGVDDISTIDAPRITSSWGGRESPKSTAELKEMASSELVAFLRSWKPIDEFNAPSVEGLVISLSSLVEEDPITYSKDIAKFTDLDAAYLHALLSGFRNAVRENKEVVWDQVLVFCATLVSKRLASRPESMGRRADRMYTESSVRQAVAELIADALQNEKSGLLPGHQQKIWSIIHPLTSDLDPSIESENSWFKNNTDPPTVTINSVRGWAMHATIRYALWSHRQDREGDFTFSKIKDARAVLELHLNPEEEQALSIHSVYGQYLPWLYSADEEWTEAQRCRIFPRDDSRRWAVAWTTYVRYCRSFSGVFAHLEDEYRTAIDHLKGDNYDVPGVSEIAAAQNLAEHLMTLYWRGTISLDEGSLLLEFFEKGSDEICAHAIEFVSRSIEMTDERIPNEVMERFKHLWSHRVAEVSKEVEQHQKELGAFGSWFACDQFGDEWGLDVLIRVLEFGSKPEHIFHLLDRLLVVADELPEMFLKCAKLLIESTKRTYDLHSVITRLLKVAPAMFESGSEGIKKELATIINRMGELGYHDARSVLPKTTWQ